MTIFFKMLLCTSCSSQSRFPELSVKDVFHAAVFSEITYCLPA